MDGGREGGRKRPAGGLDTEGLEESRVAEGQLDHLTDLGHLPPAATDVVVPLRKGGKEGGRREGGRDGAIRTTRKGNDEC